MKRRKILVHLHLFKNAGTSIDRILRHNFGPRWMAFDGDSAGQIICSEFFESVIQSHPEMEAFSSHQIVPPLPEIDALVFPIVFIRHPIERIRSAYLFEWRTQPRLSSPRGTLKEYIGQKFQNKRRNVIEEFQTIRLSNTGTRNFHNVDRQSDTELLERAMRFIEQIPCVGVVDRFDESIEVIQQKARLHWQDISFFNAHENVSQHPGQSMSEKLDSIREELGSKIYRQLLDANALDIELYYHACNLLDQQVARADGLVRSA